MAWIIEGADKKTGADVRFKLSAVDKEAAIEEAGKRGVLVSEVYDDQLGDIAAAASDYPTQRLPEYREIVKGSRIIESLAGLNVFAGCIAALVGIVSIVWGIILTGKPPETASGSPGEAIVFGLSAIVTGIVWAIIGTLLNMVSALALAIRDIARNSFRK